MATLSADSPRVFETGHDNMPNALPVVATDIIYDGAAVGMSGSTGNARPLVGGDDFAGFAVAQADNSVGSAGDVNVDVYQRGVAKLSVTGVDGINDVGTEVYASDDDTFTTTASGGSAVGKITRWISGATCLVYFEAAAIRSI